jgi:betaine-aldehyde dehydrogenase
MIDGGRRGFAASPSPFEGTPGSVMKHERKAAMTAIEFRDLYYGGGWHGPVGGTYLPTHNPATGAILANVAQAAAADVDAAVQAARAGFKVWRDVAPLERARILRHMAAIVRENAAELATLDASDGGNPISQVMGDIGASAALLEFFAGLVTEMKGASIPVGVDGINFSVRQPYGVVARIVAFNHPFLFCAAKIAAPLAAGNAVIVKPSEQAPLSALRFAELVGDLVPPGTLSIITGPAEAGAALASHPGVAKVTLVGSVAAGRAVMRLASDTIKPVLLELGGKNALIAFPDADPEKVADAVVSGMNFAWCGQSCGSTSRALIHDDIHDAVIGRLAEKVAKFRPGDPTIFVDVTADMRIAREEIFGPVLAVSRWSDEAAMIDLVNGLDVGLTCSIWTNDLGKANRTAMAVEAGYVWINETARHFMGAPFGGFKQSGIGREESLEELLSFTQEKNVYISLK